MAKKFFLICLMLIVGLHVTASAKDKGLPEENRIKVAVEITNSSRYKELPTAQTLELYLNDALAAKNFVNVVDSKTFGDGEEPLPDGMILDEDRPVETVPPAANIGELLIFEAVELPKPAQSIDGFDPTVYQQSGAKYVVRCEVLGLGVTKVEDKTIGTVTKVIGTGLNFGGANGNSHRDKVLRNVGTAIGLGGFLEIKRTALNTVVNMQFINAETGEILWQQNFIGQAIKHGSPGKDFSDPWTQAYTESVEDSAKRIAKRVNKYVDRVIIKGKSDKSFLPKTTFFNGLSLTKIF